MNRLIFVGFGLVLAAFGTIAQPSWNQPMLQPTIPPKAVEGGQSIPQWRAPLLNPTMPPQLAGKPARPQQQVVLVPPAGTNGLKFTATNVVIIPYRAGRNGRDEEYARNWDPHLMYPTYPPKLAPLP